MQTLKPWYRDFEKQNKTGYLFIHLYMILLTIASNGIALKHWTIGCFQDRNLEE